MDPALPSGEARQVGGGAGAADAPEAATHLTSRLVGRSILYHAVALGIWIVVHGLLLGPFIVDLTPLVLAWVGFSVMERKPSAYRWGLFLSFTTTAIALAYSALVLADSPLSDPGDVARNVLLLKAFAALAIGTWGLANSSALLVISKRERVRFWTRGATVGVSAFVGVPLLIILLRHLGTPAYARPAAVEERYGAQIEFLRSTAAERGYPASNSPEVAAAFGDDPEILEAAIRRGHSSCFVYRSGKATVTSSWSFGVGTAVGKDGDSFPVVIYDEPARDHDGRWVHVRMVVRDIWRRGG